MIYNYICSILLPLRWRWWLHRDYKPMQWEKISECEIRNTMNLRDNTPYSIPLLISKYFSIFDTVLLLCHLEDRFTAVLCHHPRQSNRRHNFHPSSYRCINDCTMSIAVSFICTPACLHTVFLIFLFNGSYLCFLYLTDARDNSQRTVCNISQNSTFSKYKIYNII